MDFAVITHLYSILKEKLVPSPHDQCQIYIGSTQGGYGMIKKYINGHTYRLYAHRVAKLYAMGLAEVPHGVQCSHLCHIRTCCEPSHITLEPSGINNQRKTCNYRGACTGHIDPITATPLPQCIFIKKTS